MRFLRFQDCLAVLAALAASVASTAGEFTSDLAGGWRTEMTLTKGAQQVRAITRLLRIPNGRYVGIINHMPPRGQKQPADLPLNVIYYGTWRVANDQLETDILWSSDKRFAQSSPPLKIVSVTSDQSVFSNGPNTLTRDRHNWSLESEIARTAEVAGFSKEQAQFYQKQADWKPVLGQDRESGLIVLDGDEMPSPNAVKGLSRNQNREAAAHQKLRWLQQAKSFLDGADEKHPPRPKAAESLNSASAPETVIGLPETSNPDAVADRKRGALRLFGATVAEDGEILTVDLLKDVKVGIEQAQGQKLEELLTEVEALKDSTERNRKAFLRYWKEVGASISR